MLEFDGGDLKRMKKMIWGELYKGVDMFFLVDKSVSGYIIFFDIVIDIFCVYYFRFYCFDRLYFIFIMVVWLDFWFGDVLILMGLGLVVGDEWIKRVIKWSGFCGLR